MTEISENYPVKVVDNFLLDPDGMRASALKSGFGTWSPKKGDIGPKAFEGVNFYGDHHVGVRRIVKAMNAVVYPNKFFFRVTLEGTEEAVVHSDIFTGDVSCILYLSHHEDSGTEFYRHKPTGRVALPPLADFWADPDLVGRFKRDCSSRDPEIWEKINEVPAKYNRAVFFPSPVFHCRYPYTGFGDSPETGRLIWGCHFYVEGLSYV